MEDCIGLSVITVNQQPCIRRRIFPQAHRSSSRSGEAPLPCTSRWGERSGSDILQKRYRGQVSVLRKNLVSPVAWEKWVGHWLKWTEVNLSLWFLENKPKLLHLLWTDSLNGNMLFLNKQCVNYMGQNVCFWHYNWKNHHVFIIIFRKTKFISLFLCNFAP